jgi:putative glutamine transport system permease protein
VDTITDNFAFMIAGLVRTLGLAGIAISLSLFLGIFFGALRISERPYLHYPAVAYIELVRSIPLILLIFYLFFVFGDVGIDIDRFWAAAIALTIFTSAYVAEIVRSGIASIDRGQMEAARASGLSYVQSMAYVILPQAVRRMVPALVSQFIALTKDTSLAAVIGVSEFFNRVQITNARVLTEPFLLFGFAAVVYFVINYSLSLVARRLELRSDV